MSRKVWWILVAALLALANGFLLVAIGAQPTGLGGAENLRGVAWRPDGSYALLVGDGGLLLRFDGRSFVHVASPTASALRSVAWDPSGSEALVVGDLGTVLRYRHATGAVSQLMPSPPIVDALLGVAWRNSTTALIVGSRGKLIAFEQSGTSIAFQALSSGATGALRAVDVRPDGLGVAAGEGGTVLWENATGWQNVATGSTFGFSAVAWKPGGTMGLAAGESGSLLRLDDGNATRLRTGTDRWLAALAWHPSGEYALVAGEAGVLLRYEAAGNAVFPAASATDRFLFAAACPPSGSECVLAGSGGTLRRYPNVGLDPNLAWLLLVAEGFGGAGAALVATQSRRIQRAMPFLRIPGGRVHARAKLTLGAAGLDYEVVVDNGTGVPVSDVKITVKVKKAASWTEVDERSVAVVRQGEQTSLSFPLDLRGMPTNVAVAATVSYYDPTLDAYKRVELEPVARDLAPPLLQGMEVDEATLAAALPRLARAEARAETSLDSDQALAIASSLVAARGLRPLPSEEGPRRFFGRDHAGRQYAAQVDLTPSPLSDLLRVLVLRTFGEDGGATFALHKALREDLAGALATADRDIEVARHLAHLTEALTRGREGRVEPSGELASVEEDLERSFQELRQRVDSEGLGAATRGLEQLYRAMALSLFSRGPLDVSQGEAAVAKELDPASMEEARRYGALELLREVEASPALHAREAIPASTRKALLLVYFNALEVYLQRRLKELVKPGVTILLGDVRGHINTRRRDWESRWSTLSLGSWAHIIEANDYLFLEDRAFWEARVKDVLREVRELRNVTAHPSAENPTPEAVRGKVYEALRLLPRVLKAPPVSPA